MLNVLGQIEAPGAKEKSKREAKEKSGNIESRSNFMLGNWWKEYRLSEV
jgi:hypothetical protein